MFKFNLQPGENVLITYRQAEIVLVKPVLMVFVLIYAPWAFLIKYGLLQQSSRILMLWTALIILYALYKYLLWLINAYIITDKRLISVHYLSLVHKVVLETPLDRIQNISFETKGLWRSILKVGNVVVQVASLNQPMVLKNLKNPDAVKDFLWKVHSRPRGQF